MPPTQYDIHFRLFGFSVRVQPMFWIIISLLGLNVNQQIEDMRVWFADLAVWVLAAFISILVHELGHALVFRKLMYVESDIFLYGFGGVTIPKRNHTRQNGFRGMLREIFLSFAGPLAGFILAFFILMILYVVSNGQYEIFIRMISQRGTLDIRSLVILLASNIVSISIVWGIFNLLPIFPMDGGQIFREIFLFFSPYKGRANSLVLSIAMAILLAFLSFQIGAIWMTILFAYFAYQNYRELSGMSFSR